MADDMTNRTFPNDDTDDTKRQGGDDSKPTQKLSNEDHSKGGKASSSEQKMKNLGQMMDKDENRS